MAAFSRDGLSIAYDDIAPTGEPVGTVVLIHGFATSRGEMWRRLGWLSAFERKGYRTVALDLRGHGESDKPHDPQAYGGHALLGDVLNLLDHLGIERADLMGYSMGARLALQAGLAHPRRIGNLIVGGIGGRMLDGEDGSQTSIGAMAEAMAADDPQSIADPILKGFRLFAEEQGADRLALAALSRSRGGVGAFDEAELAGLALPVLVVAGARDELAGDPQRLADAIPGARAVTLPGCDHFSAIAHALYKGAVFDFLEGWVE